ncbi:hypothetical protein ACIQPQ_31445 [Streptomyces sp. NPDC091281]|uniref:hypothetical protein n=1 Tax=Streptomyces sp. NPDC091281 TaxID=3365985 RepID=UPI003821B94E
MSCHPIPENAGHWWLCTGKWRVLHAIPAARISRDQMRDSIDTNEPIPARAACGLRRRWWMPSIGSRLGLRRCTPCCRALDIPAGHGTPANENYRKETA